MSNTGSQPWILRVHHQCRSRKSGSRKMSNLLFVFFCLAYSQGHRCSDAAARDAFACLAAYPRRATRSTCPSLPSLPAIGRGFQTQEATDKRAQVDDDSWISVDGRAARARGQCRHVLRVLDTRDQTREGVSSSGIGAGCSS